MTSQKVRKKCSTGQRFICTEVTSYKIHTLEGLIIFEFLEVDAPPATASCVRCGNGRNALNPIETGFCHVIENKKYTYPVLIGLSYSTFTFYLLECHDVSISSSYHYVRMYCNC